MPKLMLSMMRSPTRSPVAFSSQIHSRVFIDPGIDKNHLLRDHTRIVNGVPLIYM